MFDPFEGFTAGQAVDYLRAALNSGNVTHAYLMVGGAGCCHEQAALRLAAALVAGDDQEELSCALRGTHPDVRQLHPASQVGYLVEQVRDVVHDATLAPVRSARKVYVVHDADRMKGAPANAFLKTLEEPPASVHIIMLARTEGGVLQTIRSRCQVLSFTGDSSDAMPQADDEDLAFVGRILAGIAHGEGNRAILAYAKQLVEASNEGIDDLKDAHAVAEKEAADYLAAGARKNLADAHKREVSMQQRAGLMGQIDAAQAWLRDCLVICAGASELAVQTDGLAAQGALGFGNSDDTSYVDPIKAEVAAIAGYNGIINALSAVECARRRVASNVTPQLAMEAMLFEIREALCPR